MKRWLIVYVCLLLMCMTLYASGARHPADLQKAVQKGELVRIHILAHDNTPRQQELKLRVRDEVIRVFAPRLRSVRSAEEAERVIRSNLPLAVHTAQRVVNRAGETYSVTAQFGVFPFPDRVYGDQLVPAGNYTALRLLLGEAEGRNWWCVMYPPLCFSGEDYEGEIRFESSVLKWFKKRKEIRNAEKRNQP